MIVLPSVMAAVLPLVAMPGLLPGFVGLATMLLEPVVATVIPLPRATGTVMLLPQAMATVMLLQRAMVMQQSLARLPCWPLWSSLAMVTVKAKVKAKLAQVNCAEQLVLMTKTIC